MLRVRAWTQVFSERPCYEGQEKSGFQWECLQILKQWGCQGNHAKSTQLVTIEIWIRVFNHAYLNKGVGESREPVTRPKASGPGRKKSVLVTRKYLSLHYLRKNRSCTAHMHACTVHKAHIIFSKQLPIWQGNHRCTGHSNNAYCKWWVLVPTIVFIVFKYTIFVFKYTIFKLARSYRKLQFMAWRHGGFFP